MKPETYLFCIGTPWEVVKTMPAYRRLKEDGKRIHILQTGYGDREARALHELFDMPADLACDRPVDAVRLYPDAELLRQVERAIDQTRPDIVLVEDGSATAAAAALAAYARGIPVAHLDAGLRSHVETPPYFEKNQELIARLAHWHFTATEQAKCNLLEEDINPARIFEVGSTLIDAAIWTREYLHALSPGRSYSFSDDLRNFLFQCRSHRLILAITESATLAPQALAATAVALVDAVERHPESLVVWVTPPVSQARTESVLQDCRRGGHERLRHVSAIPYPGLVSLMSRCSFILTDSSYLEQQASAFAKPVLVIGENHHGHQELIKAGGARLAGTDARQIACAVDTLLQDQAALHAMQLQACPFGDGHAASRIADILSTVK